MGLLASIIVLAVLNLCLGYATAVYLGHGPPSLKAAWDAFSDDGPSLPPDNAEEELAEALASHSSVTSLS